MSEPTSPTRSPHAQHEPAVPHQQLQPSSTPPRTQPYRRRAGGIAGAAYEPVDGQDDWLEEPEELPPPAPRRRLSGPAVRSRSRCSPCCSSPAGSSAACWSRRAKRSSSSSGGSAAAGLASRFRALRGGRQAPAREQPARAGSAAASQARPAASTRPTAGTVAYLAGSTLYVTNAEGNTVKVTTSAGTSVTKTVKASVNGIHPGETVTVTGATGQRRRRHAPNRSASAPAAAACRAVRRRRARRRRTADGAAAAAAANLRCSAEARAASNAGWQAGIAYTQITNKGSQCLT